MLGVIHVHLSYKHIRRFYFLSVHQRNLLRLYTNVSNQNLTKYKWISFEIQNKPPCFFLVWQISSLFQTKILHLQNFSCILSNRNSFVELGIVVTKLRRNHHLTCICFPSRTTKVASCRQTNQRCLGRWIKRTVTGIFLHILCF